MPSRSRNRSGGCDRRGWQSHVHHPCLRGRSPGACANPGPIHVTVTTEKTSRESRPAVEQLRCPHPKMRQLFGTDGIRGVAGEYPLDRRTVFAIGRALGQRLAARERNRPRPHRTGHARVERLDQLSPGCRTGSFALQVVSAGVITTPGMAYLTRANHSRRGHRHLRFA